MILIKDARVLDPHDKTEQVADLIISDGKIEAIGSFERSNGYSEIIEAHGLTVAPGLVDVHVHFRDPGLTYKEDIQSGARAAAAGGFTTVVCMANTKPPVDTPETLRYVLEEGQKTDIHVLSAATITRNMEGRVLTDMAALKAAGAAGFTDDGMPILDENILKEAMAEGARLGLPISLHEENPAFITNNGIHQGKAAASLGITGSPALAEDCLVARDCMLALHTGAAVNIQHISSKNAVAMVRAAKEMGAPVTAEVTPHHFVLTEEALLKHGSLAKMNPPLRSEADRQALIQGLKDGVIDMIATDHAPHSSEEKSRPLAAAPSGIIGLETALALGLTYLVRPGHLSVMELMEKMSLNPGKLYHLETGRVTAGSAGDLVVFDENEEWQVGGFASKSSNSPFIGERLWGKVKYTICNGRIIYRG